MTTNRTGLRIHRRQSLQTTATASVPSRGCATMPRIPKATTARVPCSHKLRSSGRRG